MNRKSLAITLLSVIAVTGAFEFAARSGRHRIEGLTGDQLFEEFLGSKPPSVKILSSFGNAFTCGDSVYLVFTAEHPSDIRATSRFKPVPCGKYPQTYLMHLPPSFSWQSLADAEACFELRDASNMSEEWLAFKNGKGHFLFDHSTGQCNQQ
jgi:hypothetical protein